MNKFYEIIAYAKNTIFHCSAQFTLNEDNEFIETSLGSGREYRDVEDARGCFYHQCTQQEANNFTAYTDVSFELIESWENAEEEIESRTICTVDFKTA